MFFSLPAELQALVCQFAGVEEQWKRRFTYDVLPLIEKGWHEVGTRFVVVEKQYGEHMSQIVVAAPCHVCYMGLDGLRNDPEGSCWNCYTGPNDRAMVSYSEFSFQNRGQPTYMDFLFYLNRMTMPGFVHMSMETLDAAIWAWMEKVEARRNFKE